MTLVPARGMIPCRINERRCLIVIYKFYWSLPGVIVTISGENKTNYPRHTTPASQPITNGKSLLWRWRWKSIFLMQTECLNRCAKNISTQKVHELHTDYLQILYQVDCLRLSTAVCKRMSCEFSSSFWQVSEALASVDISISVSVFPSCVLLLDIYWAGADWVLPNAALCHSAKWSSGHLWAAQPNCAQTTPDIWRQTRAHTFTSPYICQPSKED